MNAIEQLTWDDIRRRIAGGALAILPVGAGAKEHGLHLPMNTDRLQAEWLAARLAERFDALIWPTLAYGHYPAFVDYAGSVSLTSETFEAVVRELAKGLLGYGVRGVVILDTGISTILPTARAVAGLANVLHLKIHAGPRYQAAVSRLSTQSHGGHADEMETSRMLVIAPERVAMEKASVGTANPPGSGPMQQSDPDGLNYSPSGAIGDPRGATREKGEELLEAMVADLEEAVEAYATFAGAASSAGKIA